MQKMYLNADVLLANLLSNRPLYTCGRARSIFLILHVYKVREDIAGQQVASNVFGTGTELERPMKRS